MLANHNSYAKAVAFILMLTLLFTGVFTGLFIPGVIEGVYADEVLESGEPTDVNEGQGEDAALQTSGSGVTTSTEPAVTSGDGNTSGAGVASTGGLETEVNREIPQTSGNAIADTTEGGLTLDEELDDEGLVGGAMMMGLFALGSPLPNSTSVSTEDELRNALAAGGDITISGGGIITIGTTLTITTDVSIHGGTIQRNLTNTSGYLISVNSPAHLTLSGVTVDGQNIDCGQFSSLINVGSGAQLCVNSNSVIKDGKCGGHCGGIWTNGNVVLDNVTVSHCYANGGFGGGIFYQAGELSLTNVIITDCHSKDEGGGIYVGSTSPLIINNGIFKVSDCSSTMKKGGGIYFDAGGNIELEGTVSISGNTAADGRSDLYYSGSADKPVRVMGLMTGDASEKIGISVGDASVYSDAQSKSLIGLTGDATTTNAMSYFSSNQSGMGLKVKDESGIGFTSLTPLTVTVTADADNSPYDTNPHGATFTSSGSVIPQDGEYRFYYKSTDGAGYNNDTAPSEPGGYEAIFELLQSGKNKFNLSGTTSDTFAIGKVTVTVTVSAVDYEFNGTASSASIASIGAVGRWQEGLDYKITYSGIGYSSATPPSSKGSYTVELGLTTAGESKFILAGQTSTTYAITGKPVTVTIGGITDGAVVPFDGEAQEVTISSDGAIATDWSLKTDSNLDGEYVFNYYDKTAEGTYTPRTDPPTGPGFYKAQFELTARGNEKYELTASSTTEVAFEITKAALTVTVSDIDKPYDAHDTFAPMVSTGAVSNYWNEGEHYTFKHTSGAAVVTPNAAGVYAAKFALTDKGDELYRLAPGSDTAATINITSKAIQIIAEDKEIVWNTSLPAFTVTAAGLCLEDEGAFAAIGSSIQYECTAASDSPVGEYPVTPSGISLPSYNLEFVAGTLTITPASLVGNITVDSYNAPYDGQAHGLKVTLSGVASDARIQYSTTGTVGDYYDSIEYTAAGTNQTVYYKVTKENYTDVEGSKTISITSRPAYIIAENKSRLVNTSNPAFTCTIAGIAPGETVTDAVPTRDIVLTCAALTTSPAGTYAITFERADFTAGSNYSVTTRDGILTISNPSTPGGGGGGGGGGALPEETPLATGGGTYVRGDIRLTPTVMLSDKSAILAITKEEADVILNDAVQKTSEHVIISPVYKNTAGGSEVPQTAGVILPAALVDGLAGKTTAELVVETPIVNVALINGALDEIAGIYGDLTITVARNVDNTILITLDKGGTRINAMKNLMKVNTAASVTPVNGAVAILISATNDENVIEKSVVDNGILYLKLAGSGKIKIVSGAEYFNDMYYEDGVEHWSKPYVDFASARRLVNGMGIDENGRNNFEPEIETTRGMLVTILNRLEDAPKAVTENIYSDITYEPAAYFENSVIWASENNIVKGMGVDEDGNNNFEPLLAITRQQLAVMLYNYAKYLGIETGTENMNSIDSYNDFRDIALWAEDSMTWSVDNGILSGKPGNILDPNAKATRCEVTAVLQRFVKNLVEK